MKSWFSIQAKQSGDAPTAAEISIHDEIGMWGVTAKDFISQMQATDAKSITLTINSPGGSVFDALAIYNALRSSEAEVTVKVLGIAASAASLIAMAGDKIVMPENTFMMVHNPLTGAYGNAADMRELADVLDKIANSLISTYVARTGQTEDKVRELLDAESWLTAAEAVELGFADELEPALKIAATFDTDRLPENVRASIAPEPEVAEDDPVAEPEAVHTATFAAQIHAHITAAGMQEFAAAWLLDSQLTTVDQVQAALKEAVEVRSLCELAGIPEMTADLINSRASLSDARRALFDAKASKSDEKNVRNHIPAQAEQQAKPADTVWNKVLPPNRRA